MDHVLRGYMCRVQWRSGSMLLSMEVVNDNYCNLVVESIVTVTKTPYIM